MAVDSGFDDKERVRTATELVDLIGSYMELRRQGRNYVALCPWHDDRRPSLQINPERQSWKCWVCDVGGDVFSFVMRREGVDFRQALEILADRAGIELRPTRGSAGATPGSAKDKRTLYQAMAWAEKQFHECLLNAPEAAPARAYLQARGISGESIKRYHIGFAPTGWQWLIDRARSTSYTQEVLQAVGLVALSSQSGRPFDFFRGRVMFPIRNPQKQTVAFGGRVLPELADDRSGKYVNSVETMLFSKSDQLYGLDIAKDSLAQQRKLDAGTSNVIVVEGYTDVIMANQHGVDNVVAVLGTALGSRHIRLLRRYTDRITLVLDGDEAGQRRMNDILELFVAESVDLRILTLPEGEDPCDFVQQRGAAALRERVEQAVDALEHKIEVETQGLDVVHDTHGAHRALERILGTIARAPRLQSGTSSDVRLREQSALNRLARDFRIPESEIRQRLTELRRRSRHRSGQQTENSSPTHESIHADPRERELLEILIEQPETAGSAMELIPVAHLRLGPLRDIYAIYCRLVAEGTEPSFNRVLTHLERPELKSLLVDLDEQAQRKATKVTEDPEFRLKKLIDNFQQEREEDDRRKKQAVLEDRNVSEKQKLDLLHELYERKRNRLDTSAPTDG